MSGICRIADTAHFLCRREKLVRSAFPWRNVILFSRTLAGQETVDAVHGIKKIAQ